MEEIVRQPIAWVYQAPTLLCTVDAAVQSVCQKQNRVTHPRKNIDKSADGGYGVCDRCHLKSITFDKAVRTAVEGRCKKDAASKKTCLSNHQVGFESSWRVNVTMAGSTAAP